MPQQTGVWENCTILNIAWSLLVMSGNAKSFWQEAVNWNIHILNKSLTLTVQNITSKKAQNGCRVIVDYFRIFGCIAYAHIPNARAEYQTKKGEACIFLGISNQSKAYKLYNSIIKRL